MVSFFYKVNFDGEFLSGVDHTHKFCWTQSFFAVLQKKICNWGLSRYASRSCFSRL